MFATAGFRPLWPVIFFLPWLILGIAYLLESVRHRRARAARVVHGKVMSLRYAGVAMCATFLLGLIALPFAPETKGQPLPD